ncbi:MAG TPA: S9 family peptidase [Actinomycetota bacterium]|nr:S9 family peptidase [Actinomycetota bacterium]
MRGFKPSDLYALEVHSDPRFSPDGTRVAFVIAGMDEKENTYPSRIWLADTRTPRLIPLTSGATRELRPRWSPDGKRIAYISHPKEKGSAVFVSTPGKRGRKVAEFNEEVEELEWSPAGDRLAAVVRDPDPRVYEVEKPKDTPGRKIDRLAYRLDGAGWTIDRPRRIYLIAANGSKDPWNPTPPGFQESGISWSPDGKEIAFSSARHDTWDEDLLLDLWIVKASGGEPRKVTNTDSVYSSTSWGPSGSIACLWSPSPSDSPRHSRIAVVNPRTGGKKVLTGNLDRNAALFPPGRAPVWRGEEILFQIEDEGNAPVYRVSSSGEGEPAPVVTGEFQVTGYDVSGDRLALTITDPSRPARLNIGSVGDESFKPIKISAGRTLFKPALPEAFDVVSKDGTQFTAWVVPPANLEKRRKYPAVLMIHGGPFTQYGNKFFDEFQVFSGAGYAVIYCNPRGSSGYSEEWGRAIRGSKVPNPGKGWGTVDFEDFMAATEHATQAFKFIDPKRLGVVGGSYGGYMASWIASHSNMFKAACSERAVNNMLTMCYTADVGSHFAREFATSYLDDPDEYLQMSPITYVRNIETPMLIMHSENDLRCPIEQAEQLFMALKFLGKEVEFVRFPEEGHELSRSGAPRHRVERFEILLDWFDRHLKPQRPAARKHKVKAG